MSALIPWLTTIVGPLGTALIAIGLLLCGAILAWYAGWSILTIVVAVPLRRSQRARDLLGQLLGTPTTTDQHYECECGAPMQNTGAYSRGEYRVEQWECTDEACGRTGRALLFEQDDESYGEGVLAGQVTP